MLSMYWISAYFSTVILYTVLSIVVIIKNGEIAHLARSSALVVGDPAEVELLTAGSLSRLHCAWWHFAVR